MLQPVGDDGYAAGRVTTPPALPAGDWSRDFSPRHVSHVVLLPALLFFLVGAAALLIVVLFAVFGEMKALVLILFALFGVAFALGGWGFFYYWLSTERQRVTCGPRGFRLETANRRQVSRATNYRWDEVTATACKVEDHEQDDRTVYSQTFHVATADGEGIRFDDSFRGFVDVIGTFNAMTPHLPYLWTPRAREQTEEHDPGSPGKTRPVDRHAKWRCAPRPAKL